MLIASLVFLASFCFYGAIASHIDNKKLIAEIKRLDEEIKKAELFIARQRETENMLYAERQYDSELIARLKQNLPSFQNAMSDMANSRGQK
jgi:uncharacterized protein YktB (UPF0637 family)